MKKRLLLCVLLACTMLCALVPVTASAADAVSLQPCYSLPFAPEGTTYGQVTFSVPADVQGLTKDAWDNGLDHNTDLILLSFVKDGVAYENMTVREIKDMLGDLPLKRTCYTYENGPDGTIYLNLRFHMDDHSKLKPSDFTAVTVKAGFVWCAGSPSGIDKELSALTLEHDVYFPVNQKAGITAVQVGAMPGGDGALRVRFERKDRESLKAISAVDLCPSAIPGKTLGDLVTIDGVTVTDLVKQGKVARFNFYGDTMIFHIDNPSYLAALKENEYEIVILPGFRWMNWNRDDWGNWAGSNKNNYTPVDGTLVLEPIVFSINASDEISVKMGGMTVLPGYKDTYYVGERIDMTSLVVRVEFASGAELDMMLLESMVSYDFSAPGTATVTVEYDGMIATYEVTVLPAPETEGSIQESTAPETTPESETATETVGSIQESTAESTAETEAAPATDADDLVPEPAIQNGCGASLAPAGMILLCLVGFAFGRKEDRDA